jgi:bacteriorhodopsin
MRGYNLETGDSPTFFRYVDWLLTVPLMCVEFYLITKKAGAKQGLMWKLILASVIMLVTGYWGEAVAPKQAAFWGLLSGLAYFWIVWMVWKGEVAQLSKASSPAVQKAIDALLKFVVIGWGIYPLGYLVGTADGQWYAFFGNLNLNMDIIYNIGDAVNKIGFGLVVYALSRTED